MLPAEDSRYIMKPSSIMRLCCLAVGWKDCVLRGCYTTSLLTSLEHTWCAHFIRQDLILPPRQGCWELGTKETLQVSFCNVSPKCAIQKDTVMSLHFPVSPSWLHFIDCFFSLGSEIERQEAQWRHNLWFVMGQKTEGNAVLQQPPPILQNA